MIEAKETLNATINSTQTLSATSNNARVVQEYELPIANDTTLGGIKVGENLSIEEDGTLNAQTGGGVTSYNDLTDKPIIPTKTSQLTNDSGFLTEQTQMNNEMILVKLTADESITISKAWTRYVVPFDKLVSQLGSNLSLTSTGSIKIGKDINVITINGTGLLMGIAGNNETTVRLTRDGVTTNLQFSYIRPYSGTNYVTVPNIVAFCEVQENDEISFLVTAGITGTINVEKEGTFLAVQKIA